MKVLLTGMLDRQLADVAAELRAEFPEAKVEVIGNDQGGRRILKAVSNAALVLSGRFINHDAQNCARMAGVPFRVASKSTFADVLREFTLTR